MAASFVHVTALDDSLLSIRVDDIKSVYKKPDSDNAIIGWYENDTDDAVKLEVKESYWFVKAVIG
jgi:hypothetical protein